MPRKLSSKRILTLDPKRPMQPCASPPLWQKVKRQSLGRTFADIRPLAEEDIELLDQHMPFGATEKHRERLGKQQEGKIVYRVVSHGNLPVGQALLRWDGSPDEPMAARLHSCPEM